MSFGGYPVTASQPDMQMAFQCPDRSLHFVENSRYVKAPLCIREATPGGSNFFLAWGVLSLDMPVAFHSLLDFVPFDVFKVPHLMEIGRGVGSELVIGPWSHAGYLDNRAGHSDPNMGRRSRFHHTQHIINYFDRFCSHRSSGILAIGTRSTAFPCRNPFLLVMTMLDAGLWGQTDAWVHAKSSSGTLLDGPLVAICWFRGLKVLTPEHMTD